MRSCVHRKLPSSSIKNPGYFLASRESIGSSMEFNGKCDRGLVAMMERNLILAGAPLLIRLRSQRYDISLSI
jgi:hypothetical protein